MNGIRTAFFSNVNDLICSQVRIARGRWAEHISLICVPHVQGLPVRFGVHGDCFESAFPASAQNANGDFPSVGDQDFFKHNTSFVSL
jgi:hypothetical protein